MHVHSLSASSKRSTVNDALTSHTAHLYFALVNMRAPRIMLVDTCEQFERSIEGWSETRRCSALSIWLSSRCAEDGERSLSGRAVGLDRSESNPRLGATSGGGGRGWAAEGAATAGAIARMRHGCRRCRDARRASRKKDLRRRERSLRRAS